MAISIGQQLGNYRLIQLLGKGGFAEVYLAEHSYLGTYAAIKVLGMRITSDNIELFSKEARTIASLVHPHILRVLDFGIERGIPYLVMDYAPNGTLRHRHPRGSFLSLETVVSYVEQIASALQYIHERKLIHRDIKPENLLIGRNGEILISDFGIAVMAHSSRSLNTEDASGTVYYMAPEQIQGKPRMASDQYALGIVAYEWLCGSPPFTGTAMEIGMQHLLTPPQSLKGRVSTIPSDVEQIVLTALAKDPHQRYDSVQEFADALEQAGRLSIGTIICTYTGHPGKGVIAVWSPDSKYIASVSVENWPEDRIVQIWNATDGNQVHTYPIDDPSMISLAWISNIPHVALARSEFNGRVRIIDTLAEYEVVNFCCDFGDVNAMTWSPNGKFIATVLGSQKGVWVGLEEREFVDEGYSLNKIEVRDVNTGAIIGQYSFSEDPGRLPFVWSPDSTHIAFILQSSEGMISVWRVTADSEVLSYRGDPNSDELIAWSPDGKFIATAGYKVVRVLNTFTGDEVLAYLGHSQWVTAIAWSPDSQYIISASGSYSNVKGEYEHSDNIVHIWNASSGENIFPYHSKFGVAESIVWSPDGKRIAITFEDGKVQVWRAA